MKEEAGSYPASTENCANCSGCSPVLAARNLAPHSLRLAASYASLLALLAPGAGFIVLLLLVEKEGRFSDLATFGTLPWQFWFIAIFGTLATLSGIADWGFHRWIAKCKIGKAERRCELLALAAGGAPVFILMALASTATKPESYLVPVVVLVLFTTVLICYDEFVFHSRRCKKLETAFHRVLVLGNAIAFLAWFHWCFVNEHMS